MLITVSATLYSKRVSLHQDCFVCGQSHPFGLRLQFTIMEPGRVWSRITCDKRWNGYAAFVHGGIVASIVDGAMTHALFSAGIIAVTASLTIRYHHSLHNDCEMEVEAYRVQSRRRLHCVEATIRQNQKLCISAESKFMESTMSLDSAST